MPCCRRKELLLLYICLVLIAWTWVISNFGLWGPCQTCPDQTTNQQLQETMEQLIEHNRRLEKKNSEQKNYETKLIQAEVSLRQKYGQRELDILSFLHNNLPVIYAITPTYMRPEQKAELTRLTQTFLHLRSFHWILVEDSIEKTDLVSNFLATSGLNYTHLNVKTPDNYKMKENDPNWLKPRGVLQRNLALRWLRTTLNLNSDKGVIYFADDDNTYDLRIFEEMRYTKKVSVWPVGLVGKQRYESPIVENGKVVGWFTYWKPDRPFAMDMAGFAVNLQLILENPQAEFSLRVRRGYQESELLRQIVTLEELEPLAQLCTKVLVWHTRTEKSDLRNEAKLQKQGNPSNPLMEV